MALTTTYASGATTATTSVIGVNAYTSPASSGIGPKVLGRYATGEYVLITGFVGTSLQVVRGYNGSVAKAHSQYEGFQYGLDNDSWPATSAPQTQIAPVFITNAQEVTLTGTTGTDAAVVTAPSGAILNCSGASGAGVNLPVPSVGMSYAVKNTSSGTMKIYCVGGSLNGTTGTTAVSLTTTGTLGDHWYCATSGAWQGVPTSV